MHSDDSFNLVSFFDERWRQMGFFGARKPWAGGVTEFPAGSKHGSFIPPIKISV